MVVAPSRPENAQAPGQLNASPGLASWLQQLSPAFTTYRANRLLFLASPQKASSSCMSASLSELAAY